MSGIIEYLRAFNLPSAILTIKLSRKNASHSAILSSLAELKCVDSVQELIS